MFLLLPGIDPYLQIFLLLALAPAVILMVYVYRLDPIDKEPGGLLWSLVLRGVLAGLIAGALEGVGMQALGLFTGLEPDSVQFTVVSDIVVVGAIEEGAKYWLMARKTWRNPSFNCRFDGVVYAVFTSLGFAAMENVMYGLTYGSGVLVQRAFMAIPAHMGFAVIFGLLYGQARCMSHRRRGLESAACIAGGYLLSVFLHGAYDSAAMVSSVVGDSLFLLVVATIYIVNLVVVRVAARHDCRIG